MIRVRLGVFLLALMGFAGWPVTSGVVRAQEQTVVVEGQFSNGTPGGGSVSGMTVLLHQESETAHEDLEASTDEDGRFRFDGVAFDPATEYAVSATYQGAMYGMDLDLSATSTPPISLTVYDATDSLDVLSVPSASILVDAVDSSAQLVSVLEITRLSNDSDRTYVPGQDPMRVPRFGLPSGSQDLKVDTDLMAAEFIQVDRGFALASAVPPGAYALMYSYQVSYSGSSLPFDRSFPLGVGYLRILAPTAVAKLSSDELGSPRSITLSDQASQLIEAEDLPSGAQISFTLGEFPRPSDGEKASPRPGGLRLEYAAPIGLGLVMAFVIGYGVLRRARHRRAGDAEAQGTPEGSEERQVLTQMIVDLEEGLKAGAIGEREYQRRLAALNSRLASLTAE